MNYSNENLEQLYRDKYYHNHAKDEFGRYNYLYSDRQEIFQPSVSKHLFDNGFAPVYPGNKDFAVCLTHDIDFLTARPSPAKIINHLKEGKAGGIFSELYKLANKWNNPNNNIHKLLEHEARYGVHSTSFFLSLKKGEKDFNYHPKEIKHILKQVKDAGSEIGLHGGHDASASLEKILSEKKMLEDVAAVELKGYRSHFLRFEFPDTWEYLDQAGFEYDSTFCYPDVIGFRNGMCYPFKPLGEDRRITELPLIIADHLFFFYMRTPEKVAFDFIEKFMDKVKALKGVLVILWHNYFYSGKWVEFYDRILQSAKERNAWFPTMLELNNHWKQQNYFDQYKKIAPAVFG